MRRNPPKGNIRPKISTMPRPKSEAAAFLDIYKLVVEKKRLQQELQTLDERRKQICDRIAILDQRTGELEASVERMRNDPATVANTPQAANLAPVTLPDNFETMFLEY